MVDYHSARRRLSLDMTPLAEDDIRAESETQQPDCSPS